MRFLSIAAALLLAVVAGQTCPVGNWPTVKSNTKVSCEDSTTCSAASSGSNIPGTTECFSTAPADAVLNMANKGRVSYYLESLLPNSVMFTRFNSVSVTSNITNVRQSCCATGSNRVYSPFDRLYGGIRCEWNSKFGNREVACAAKSEPCPSLGEYYNSMQQFSDQLAQCFNQPAIAEYDFTGCYLSDPGLWTALFSCYRAVDGGRFWKCYLRDAYASLCTATSSSAYKSTSYEYTSAGGEKCKYDFNTVCTGIYNAESYVTMTFPQVTITSSDCSTLNAYLKNYVSDPDDLKVICNYRPGATSARKLMQTAANTNVMTVSGVSGAQLQTMANLAKSDSAITDKYGPVEVHYVAAATNDVPVPEGYISGAITFIVIIAGAVLSFLTPKLLSSGKPVNLTKTHALAALIVSAVSGTIALSSSQWLRQVTPMFVSLGVFEGCTCQSVAKMCKPFAPGLGEATMVFHVILSVVTAITIVVMCYQLFAILPFGGLQEAQLPLPGVVGKLVQNPFVAIGCVTATAILSYVVIAMFNSLLGLCVLSGGAMGISIPSAGASSGAASAAAVGIPIPTVGASWILIVLAGSLYPFAASALFYLHRVAKAQPGARTWKETALIGVNFATILLLVFFTFVGLITEAWVEPPVSVAGISQRSNPFQSCTCASFAGSNDVSSLATAAQALYVIYFIVLLMAALVIFIVPVTIALIHSFHEPTGLLLQSKWRALDEKVSAHRKKLLLGRSAASVGCIALTMLLITVIPLAETLGFTRSVLGYGLYFAMISLFAEFFHLGFVVFQGWPEDANRALPLASALLASLPPAPVLSPIHRPPHPLDDDVL